MTRREYEEQITDFGDLKDFCGQYGCDLCDNVFDDAGRNEYIEGTARDEMYDYGWREVLRYLENLSTDENNYWELDDYGDWYGLGDDDFEARKGEVFQWAIENNIFEEDDDADDERGEVTADGSVYSDGDSDDADFEFDSPDFEVDDLFNDAASGFAQIEEAWAIMRAAAAATEHKAEEEIRKQREEQAAADALEKAEFDASFLDLFQTVS